MNDWKEQLKEVSDKMFPDRKDKMIRYTTKRVKVKDNKKNYVKLHK